MGVSEKWDKRFIELAKHIATWSKDRSRQVGCVIVGQSREILAVGYNGFPRGIDDNVEERHQRPAKYQWTEHAERNAIYNAARVGVSLLGSTAYVPWYPCADCGRALIQVGIVTLVSFKPNFDDPRFGNDFKIVNEMFHETAIMTRFVEGSMGDAK